uniref:Uncharacterized protein n=1 Tax=Rhizophora mucronata TaxID=61149 RepID=A0A2P2PBJ5_RHIMU
MIVKGRDGALSNFIESIHLNHISMERF